LLDVPVDIQDELIDWSPELVPSAPAILRAGASAEVVARLADELLSAQRPLIVAGRGAKHAKTELLAVGERVGAILVPSGGARGLVEGETWGLDVMGGFATDGATELMQEADLLVVFGAALTKWTARGGALTDGKRIIQIDDDATAFGLHRPVELGILGDARSVAGQ